ncbi:hypothetical protein BURPSS13_B0023 [Burkholderia pseudomallei S13]|nr:hypothetical protein BURPSS13_B0023 [Burkholderia pseudomallei S13]
MLMLSDTHRTYALVGADKDCIAQPTKGDAEDTTFCYVTA